MHINDRSMGLNIPWSLFKKLIQNQISDNERNLLMEWRNSSEVNAYIFDEIADDESLKQLLLSNKWEDNSSQWETILSRISPVENEFTLSRKRFFTFASAAAVLLLLLGIGMGIWYSIFRYGTGSDQSYTYIYSPRGQRTQVILPDSTKVWLNSETSIRYPASFNRKSREVTIEGEAFFKVKKNPDKPFYVNTSDIKVKVYGTSFNVKAYPNERFIETTLIEGKLSVIPKTNTEDSYNEIFLKPKDRLKYKRPGFFESDTTGNLSDTRFKKVVKARKEATPKMLLSRNINPDQENLWKDGKLIFMDERFGDMAIKLERWFDVRIHFEDEKIKDFRFTGQFDKETINQAMEALKISSQHSYKYEMTFRDIYLKLK